MATELNKTEQPVDQEKGNEKRYHKQLNRTEETIIDDPRGYQIHNISKMSQLINEFVTHGKKKNTIWSFTNVDVTETKRKIAEYRENTGNPLSFTAFIITVFARVVANHKHPMNALLKRNKKLYIFVIGLIVILIG